MKRRKWFLFIFTLCVLWSLANYIIYWQCPDCNENNLEKEESLSVRDGPIVKAVASQSIRNGNLDEKLQWPQENDATASTLHRHNVTKSHMEPSKTISKSNYENGRAVIAILVISCNRVTVRRCLDSLFKFRPSKDQFPIIVSQDCSHKPTIDAILSYGNRLTLIRQPDQSEINVPPKEKKFRGYFKISRHYGWALNQTFFNYKYKAVIVVEDDVEISPDFFSYFQATYWLLQEDPSIWCVSAWNDNGRRGMVDDKQPQLLYRTDFFPGLGWMLTDSTWAELAHKWPHSYWDDWMRKPEQRRERACIRPEISRTKTFGKVGVSNGMYFEKHLKYIKLNEQYVDFSRLNLTYLLKDNYDRNFVKQVYECQTESIRTFKFSRSLIGSSVRIPYKTRDEYKRAAKLLGLMDDLRSGVPRTAYRGIVSTFYHGLRVFLSPEVPWTGYNATWN